MIYVIRELPDGPVKIGHAADVEARCANLQCGNPRPLGIVGTLPGARREEAHLHRELAEFRLRGEWYLPHEKVLSVPDRYAQGVPMRPPGDRIAFNRCKHGHHYSRENMIFIDGKRRCKTCVDYESSVHDLA